VIAAPPPPPTLALSASPARVALVGAARQNIRVRNAGAEPVVVVAGRAGYAIDLLGRPRLSSEAPAPWLRLTPTRVTVPAGGTVTLTVASLPAPGTSPGDHYALALLTSRSRGGSGVAVRTRIGIVVSLRMRGRVVHRLALRSLRAHGSGRTRVLTLTVANRGNIAERFRGSRISLHRGSRLLTRLWPQARELLPRTARVARVRCPARLHGWVTAVVELLLIEPNRPTITRRFRLRL